MAAELNRVTVTDLVLTMTIIESCCFSFFCLFCPKVYSVSVLMSALLFRHLNCWIIDHRLWFETLASSDGGQHNLILFTLCRSLGKSKDPTYWVNDTHKLDEFPISCFQMTCEQGKDKSVQSSIIQPRYAQITC